MGCHLHLFRRQPAWAPAQPAPGAGCAQPCHSAVADQVPLELGQGREDMKLEFAHRAGGVDALIEAAEADLALLQLFHPLDKVLERPAQAVQAPDDQCVAGAHERECLLEARPLGLGAAHLVGKNFLAAGLLEGVGLQVEVLFAGGDAGIAYEHGGRGELVGGIGMSVAKREVAIKL